MKRNSIPWTRDTIFRSCPLCGGDKAEIISRHMQHRLDLNTVICRQCGLVFTNPLPPIETYSRFYTDAYSLYYGHITAKPEGHRRMREPSKAKYRLDKIEPIRPLAGSRLLEVGPGLGLILWWAQKRGSSVLGVEPSTEFYNALVGYGLPCVHGSLEQVQPEQVGRFDIILMSHVLEHFYDPNQALNRCWSLLESDGILAIEVPNILRPHRSLDRYFLRYVHPTNFSPKTLQSMLEKHGFSPVYVNEGANDRRTPQHLFVVARKSNSVAASFSYPDQTADEVIKILQSYRRRWLLGGGLTWHIWNGARRYPLMLQGVRRARRLFHLAGKAPCA